MKKSILFICLTVFVHLIIQAQSINIQAQADVGIKTNDVCTDWQTTNYGTTPSVTIAHWTWYGPGCGEGIIRGLFQFDLNLAPDHTRLYDNRATLTLYFPTGSAEVHNYVGSATDNQLYIERITQSWGEMTATWNNQPTVTTTGAILVPSSSTNPSTEDYFLDVSTMVYEWICNAQPNYGFRIRLVNETELYRRASFTNREWADPLRRPTLTMEYAQISGSSNDDTICDGGTFQLNCSLTNANNPAQYFFTWTHLNSSTTYATQNVTSPTYNPGQNTYVVNVTNPWCQTATDTVTVYVVDGQTISFSPTAPSICAGDSVTITASGASSFAWSHSLGNGASQTVSPSTTTTYTVTGTTSGCDGTAQVTVTVTSNADATITSAGPFCSNDPVATLSAITNGGIWSGTGITNSTNGTFNPNTAGPGTHTITYGISGSCGDTATTEITVYSIPVLASQTTNESCTGAGDGEISLTVTQGTPPFVYVWSPSGSGTSTSNLTANTYSITVTDANGCTINENVLLTDPLIECDSTIAHVFVPTVFSPNGDGINDVLYVRGEKIQTLEFVIYSRWGQKIFESSSKEIGWDGTKDGKHLDPGVFVYYVLVTTTENERIEIHGDVTLVR